MASGPQDRPGGVDQLVSPASAPRYSPAGLHGLGRNDHCGRRGRPARLAASLPVTELRMSPGERFEVLVDFADGKAVTLETGPDQELGAFGAMMEHRIDGEYEPVMRFEATAAVAPVKTLPTSLVAPQAADPNKAVRRRQFILDSRMCTTDERPSEMPMGHAMCI